MFIEILTVMAKSYQLVAWTDHGRLRMIPSQISAFLLDATDEIDRLAERIRHGTCHEVNDTLAVSRAYEKLGLWLLELGQMKEAFGQFAQAALCCGASDSTWTDTEWGEELCKPLRGRFFVLFRQCKDLVRTYPQLRYSWEKSGLQQRCDFITSPPSS